MKVLGKQSKLIALVSGVVLVCALITYFMFWGESAEVKNYKISFLNDIGAELNNVKSDVDDYCDRTEEPYVKYYLMTDESLTDLLEIMDSGKVEDISNTSLKETVFSIALSSTELHIYGELITSSNIDMPYAINIGVEGDRILWELLNSVTKQ